MGRRARWCALGVFVVVVASSCTQLIGLTDIPSAGEAGDGGKGTTDAGGSADSGMDSINALGPPGCSMGAPTTYEEILNHCTTAPCVAFDNCARIGQCDGGWPTPIPPPEAGTSPQSHPPTIPDGGCYDPVMRPHPLFMQGSTGFTPFIEAMATIVGPSGYTLVWQPTSSCSGAGAGGFAATPDNLMQNPTSSSQTPASYYDSTGAGTPCLLGNSPRSPDGVSEVTDIGESDIFATTCNAAWEPGGTSFPSVASYLGPIESYVFVTPALSTERVISAEAATVVFGAGGNHGLSTPWINPADMLIRTSSTGTNNIMSLGINISPLQWWGVVAPNLPALQQAIIETSTTSAQATIGTLSIDYADPVRTSLNILYYQAHGQLCGFLPDSSPSANDKINVRDGHYSLWGPVHLYTLMVGGAPTAQASAFILPFNELNESFTAATIKGDYVPQCAMYVERTTEMGSLQPFTPTHTCYCYYEVTANGVTSCQKCDGPGDCPANKPACNLGYCEVQ